MTDYTDGFYLEAHFPNQIHNQQLNKNELGEAIDAAIDYFKSWGVKRIELLVFKPKRISQTD